MSAIEFRVLSVPKQTSLDQLLSFQARVTFVAYDDLVVHDDAERLRDLDNRLCHLNVRARRRRVATWVIMQQTTLRAIELISLGI